MERLLMLSEKVGIYNVIDKEGNVSDITFTDREFTSGSYGYLDDRYIRVPKLFLDFMVKYYKEANKTVSPGTFLKSLFMGKKTALIKEFIKRSDIKDLSDSKAYFGFKNGTVSYDSSYLHREWDTFRKYINFSPDWDGDWAEFLEVQKDDKRYSFVDFCGCNGRGMAYDRLKSRFDIGYNESTDFIFDELKEEFAKLSDVDHDNVSQQNLAEIMTKCNLPDDVINSIKNGKIKVLYFAKGTGVSDQIIWYSGEFSKENIKIHLIAENEDVTDITDNTEEINDIIKYIFDKAKDTYDVYNKKEVEKIAKDNN